MAAAAVVETMDCAASVTSCGSEDLAEELKKKGNSSFQQQDYRSAIDFYSQALCHNPRCAAYYGNRSAAYMMLEDYSRALDDSITSIKLEESFTKGYLRAAKCHLMLGNPSLSLDFYEKVLNVEPKNQQAIEEMQVSSNVKNHLAKAIFDSQRGEYRDAVFRLDQCLRAAPYCILFRVMKAEALVMCSRCEEAHDLCKLVLCIWCIEVLRVDAHNVDAIYVKALCFYYQDIPDKATQFFQEVLRVDPDHVKSRNAIKRSKLLLAKKEQGNTLFKLGNNQAAYDMYSEALSIDPKNNSTNAKLLCNRALVGSKLGKVDQAIEDCTKALEMDPKYIRALQRRATLYQSVDKHDEAVRDLEQVFKLEHTRENQEVLQEAKQTLKLSKRKDYYKLLEVDKSASQDEIKRGYRKAAMKHHPDRHVDAEPEVREKEEQIFKQVSEAYSVLSDPKKKSRYDNGYDLEETGGMDMDPTILFSNLFGGMGENMAGLAVYVAEDKALQALTKAVTKQVQLAFKALVEYDADGVSDCPHPSYALSFKKNHYLHMKQKYNDDWWIGRVVGECETIGFLPSELKLKALVSNGEAVYQAAPIMRPIVFMGPSNKKSELTKLLQSGLINFMKERFAGRLNIVQPLMSIYSMSSKQSRDLALDVREAGASLKLVFMNCDASFPTDLDQAAFHPLIIYIQISRRKVLERLLKESSLRRREAELSDAYRLYDHMQHTPCPYSLIITDSNLDDATQNLELFLESYWASTRSVPEPATMLQDLRTSETIV
eukprot:Em0012g1092a